MTKLQSLLSIIKKVLRYFLKNIFYYRTGIIFERDINIPCTDISKLKLSFKFASKNEINLLGEEKHFMNQDRKNYLFDRLEKGDKCLLAIHKNRVIGYGCIMKNEFEISEKKHISLPPNKIYTYNAHVIDEYRGKHIFRTMIEYLINNAKKNSRITYEYFVISSKNKASLNAHKNNELFKVIGKIIHIKLLFLKYDYLSKKCKQYIQK